MNSTPSPKATESNNPLVTRADEQIARAHEQIRHADEQLARVTEQLAKMGLDAGRAPSAVADPKPPPGRPARRVLVGLLLLSCAAVAVLFSQSSYSGGARRIAARWAPRFVSTSSSTREDPAPPAASPLQMAPAEAATPQVTPPAQTAAQDAAPAAAAALPDQTQLQQTLARDLANVQRDIEQLKATQQQMAGDNSRAVEQLKAIQQQIASDNSKAIEQLKASQEEMKRQLAAISEQNLSRTPQQNLSRTSPPPAQPTAILRKPRPRPYPPYERARIPSQWDYEEW
jgi:septal ring factor EnvC (AmiA/AmiB activator)